MNMLPIFLMQSFQPSKMELVKKYVSDPKKVISKLSHCSILVWCFIKESDHLFTWIKTYHVNALNHVTDFSFFTNFVDPNGQKWKSSKVTWGQGSTDNQAREPTGPNRSEIFKILLVLVRSGPRFWNFSGSLSGLVLDFQNFVGPVLVRGSLLGPIN